MKGTPSGVPFIKKVMNEFYKVVPEKPLSGEYVELKFDFSIDYVPEVLPEDKNFPYPDEIFLVNFGETGKFTSNFIYQSRFVALKANDGLIFNGYAPDFCRKSDIIERADGSTRFEVGKKYSVTVALTEYRAYVSIGGEAKTSYGNGRKEITDVAFYLRSGVKATLENVTLTEKNTPCKPIDRNLKSFIDNGIVSNYLFWHNAPDGVYFDRLNVEQNIKCTTRNSGAYQSNVVFDMYTTTRKIGIEYEITDLPAPDWQTQFGFTVNGKNLPVNGRLTRKNRVYYDEFVLPASAPKYNRITLTFPFSAAMAVKRVTYDFGAKFKAPLKKKKILFLGDSITEGSECFDPAAVYVSQVCRAYDCYGLDQAVSGRTFNDYNILGDYPFSPDYVFIANGTNSFCGGTGDKTAVFKELDSLMTLVINEAKSRFPSAKIIALLPIWRSDEKGVNFSLDETSEMIESVYGRYPEISVIDCRDFVPEDASYFSNSELALHPNSAGHRIYGKRLLQALKNIMGEPKLRDETAEAERALKKQ